MCAARVSRPASGVATNEPVASTPLACSARAPGWRPKRWATASMASSGVSTEVTLSQSLARDDPSFGCRLGGAGRERTAGAVGVADQLEDRVDLRVGEVALVRRQR